MLEDATNMNHNRSDRTMALLDVLEDRIKIDPSAFSKFVDILKSEPHLVEIMESKQFPPNSHTQTNHAQRAETVLGASVLRHFISMHALNSTRGSAH